MLINRRRARALAERASSQENLGLSPSSNEWPHGGLMVHEKKVCKGDSVFNWDKNSSNGFHTSRRVTRLKLCCVTTRKSIQYSMKTHSICDSPL